MYRETIKLIENCLFTTSHPNETLHRCVVVIDPSYAVTFKHGDHSHYKVDDNVTLYNVVNKELAIKVVVHFVSPLHDFILFKVMNETFKYYPCDHSYLIRGKTYFQVGLDRNRKTMWKNGIVSRDSSKRIYQYGTSHGECGDSGSGIFAENGAFGGMPCAKKDFEFSTLNITADHHPETAIIPAVVIRSNIACRYSIDEIYIPTEKNYGKDSGQ